MFPSQYVIDLSYIHKRIINSILLLIFLGDSCIQKRSAVMNPSSSTGATAGGGRMPNQQPRPSRASMEGVSPLMYSCQQNNVQQVRQLLQRKVIAITFYWIFFAKRKKLMVVLNRPNLCRFSIITIMMMMRAME